MLMPDRPRWKNRATAIAALLAGCWMGPVASASTVDRFEGRALIVHVPASLPPAGTRALVVVLHGGMGNADRIADQSAEQGLNMDAVADRNGFVVVYLNGTPVTRRLGPKFLGWNAGGCCGMSAENKIDDVGYIAGAVDYLAGKYGIDKSRVYGVGHSNGAMMSQRIVCETTLYAAAVAISGPLGLDTAKCPGASGRRILAIHGADDQNVPIGGGRGKGLSDANFHSEEQARTTFTNSGATYTLEVVPGAAHQLAGIQDVIVKTQGVTIAEKAARFFGLTKPNP
jgi:polyhydroxybutyrate depolymerase